MERLALISVVIVAYNSAEVLPACLSALQKRLPDASVIVVDNASSDESARIAARFGATVVPLEKNQGYGTAVNIGIASASNSLCLVLNPDVELVDIDHARLQGLDDQPGIGLLAAQEVGTNQADQLYPAFSVLGELWWAITTWLLLPRGVRLRRRRLRWIRARYVGGAAFVVRREEFMAVRGFDENLFLYFEDYDLSNEYALRRLPVRVSDAVLIRHAHGQSSPRREEEMMAYALLSLIQVQFKRRGQRSAALTARVAVAAVRAVAAMGSTLRRIPRLGEKGAKKAAEAESLLDALGRECVASDQFYPNAKPAMRDALGGRSK